MRTIQRSQFLLVATVVLLAIFLCVQPGQAVAETNDGISEDGVWVALPVLQAQSLKASAALMGPQVYRAYGLNKAVLTKVLGAAPMEFTHARSAGQTVITLPMPEGKYQRFNIEVSPILSLDLQAEHPDIQTYRAQGIDDPSATARLDLTPLGFHAQILSSEGSVLVDPMTGGNANVYVSFWKHDARGEPFQCYVEGGISSMILRGVYATRPSGDQLRTYRLAMTATGEYTQYFEARQCANPPPAGCGRNAAIAQITTTVNRVTGIYEREVAVRFTLTATNIYEDPDDPFPTGTNVNGALLDQNQADLDAKVGSANYDIGHIVSAGGDGGYAGVGVVCNNASKGRGGTSRPDPLGDPFDVDYVAHEMGHQMGGNHTFNGTTGSCGGGNRAAGSAYEPGSGTTIMAYAGICGAEDVQPNSDDYFHTKSFDEITTYRDGGGAACGTQTATGNNAPTVNAGADYTIPRNTPFTLTASGSDPDGDALTYCWEEFDLGAATPPPNMADGPLLRSRPPTASPSRTFPQLSDILSGTTNPWERLPTVDRTLTFRVTARDNHINGGGVDYDTMTVTVTGDPFQITRPASGDRLECGGNTQLTWDAGGGSMASDVKALISYDGGNAFADLLSSTPNDGNESVTVPKNLTNTGRIKLEAIGNIFFDISGPFSIVDTTPPVLTPPASLPAVECTSHSGASPALGAATATDLCDASLDISNNAPGVFPLGTTSVSWTAMDDSGNVSQAAQMVTVVDTTPPTISAPPNVTAECTSPAGTPVALGTPTTSDICDSTLAVSNNAPPLFGLGSTSVSWTALDDSGNSASAAQLVTIQDTTPPTLHLSVSPSVLWSPDHKMVTIQATITATDICDAHPMVRLVSITSNESDNGLGDGDTSNDIQGASFGQDDREFRLRAERSGTGSGRIYPITYAVTDGSGNSTLGQATVQVPKSSQ